MTRVLGAALVAVLAAVSIPAVAAGQETAADSLLRRIDLIERRTIELERRVRELEGLLAIEPARTRAVAASSQSQDVQNWRRLRLSMTMDQVRALLGEPERVHVAGPWTFWNWDSLGGANVRFYNRSGEVDAWSEPHRR